MKRPRPSTRSTELVVAACAAALVVAACWHPKRESVSRVPHLAYPDCGHGPLDFALPAETLVDRELWTGHDTGGEPTVEHFTLARRECLTIGTARVERPYQMIDLEVVWDVRGRPLPWGGGLSSIDTTRGRCGAAQPLTRRHEHHHDDQLEAGEHRGAGEVEVEQRVAFGEERGFGGVQVFGLPLAQHATTKGLLNQFFGDNPSCNASGSFSGA